MAAVAAGSSARAAAERFGVSASTAIRWAQRWRAEGEACARPMGGDHRSRLTGHREAVLTLVAFVWVTRRWALTRPLRFTAGLLLAFGLLGAAIQPWYVLWALVPLAAWASRVEFRLPVVAVSAVLACFTLPPGAGLPPFVTVQAWAATVAVVAVLLVALFRWPGLLRFR